MTRQIMLKVTKALRIVAQVNTTVTTSVKNQLMVPLSLSESQNGLICAFILSEI